MLALIVGSAKDEQVRLIVRLLERTRFEVRFTELVSLRESLGGNSGAPDYVFLFHNHESSEPEQRVAEVAAGMPSGTFLIFVSDSMSAEDYRALVRTGRGEWIRWQSLESELLELLQRRSDHRSHGRDAATLVSFLPSAGGVGNTTLALESAVHLVKAEKRQRTKRACVLDLNFQRSSIPDYLDVEPRFDITELVDNPARLDDHLVDLVTTTHVSGVDFFCSPPHNFDYSRLDQRFLFALLDEIAKRYDFVHLDLPPIWFPWVDGLVIGSDVVVVTGGYSVPAVKRIAERLRHLEALSVRPEIIGVAINRCERKLFGGIMRKSDISAALVDRKLFYLAADQAAADEAINTGRSLMLAGGRQRFVKDLRKLAEWINGRVQGDEAAKVSAT